MATNINKNTLIYNVPACIEYNQEHGKTDVSVKQSSFFKTPNNLKKM